MLQSKVSKHSKNGISFIHVRGNIYTQLTIKYLSSINYTTQMAATPRTKHVVNREVGNRSNEEDDDYEPVYDYSASPSNEQP